MGVICKITNQWEPAAHQNTPVDALAPSLCAHSDAGIGNMAIVHTMLQHEGTRFNGCFALADAGCW